MLACVCVGMHVCVLVFRRARMLTLKRMYACTGMQTAMHIDTCVDICIDVRIEV